MDVRGDVLEAPNPMNRKKKFAPTEDFVLIISECLETRSFQNNFTANFKIFYIDFIFKSGH